MKKNLITAVFAAFCVLGVLGCGIIDRVQEEITGSGANTNTNANKTLTDKAVDTAVGESKIGVPECDEVMDMLTSFANNPDDNFVVKAGKSMLANKIRDSIKTSVEQNQTDKVQLAKDCAQFKTEIQRAMAQSTPANSNNQ